MGLAKQGCQFLGLVDVGAGGKVLQGSMDGASGPHLQIDDRQILAKDRVVLVEFGGDPLDRGLKRQAGIDADDQQIKKVGEKMFELALVAGNKMVQHSPRHNIGDARARQSQAKHRHQGRDRHKGIAGQRRHRKRQRNTGEAQPPKGRDRLGPRKSRAQQTGVQCAGLVVFAEGIEVAGNAVSSSHGFGPRHQSGLGGSADIAPASTLVVKGLLQGMRRQRHRRKAGDKDDQQQQPVGHARNLPALVIKVHQPIQYQHPRQHQPPNTVNRIGP